MHGAEPGRLRVGILCDGLVFQRWQAECIRQVMAVEGVDIVVLVENAKAPASSASTLQRVKRHPWRMSLYLAWRRRMFKPAAMEEVGMEAELGHVTRVRCRVQQRGPSQFFAPVDIDELRHYWPDVLLRFGFNILRGEIISLPLHGVWSFHHGDEQKYRGGPPGFWEIMRGDPVTGAILQRLTEKLDGGIVLRKGWFNTVPHSLADSVNNVLMNTVHWPAQVCGELLRGRVAVVQGPASSTDAPIFKYPGNFTFLSFLRRQMENKMRFHRNELRRHEEWNIGVLHQPIASLLGENPSLNVRWLPAPGKGTYRADPFGYMAADGQLNVLYEKFDYRTGTGAIYRLRPRRDSVLKRSRKMLVTDLHLSYPYVVLHDNVVHCVPESSASGRVDLYRVSADNDSLEFVRTLLDEALFDPTLFEHQGRWWLFGTKAPLTNVALHAYYSDRFEGPYRPHALNPIKMDVRGSRPAGTPFLKDGDLYRPAQDSSTSYGYRIALNIVHLLTPDDFREELVKHIGPFKGPYGHGLHTLAAAGEVTLVDGKRYVHVRSQEYRVRQRKWSKVRHRDRSADVEEDDEEGSPEP